MQTDPTSDPYLSICIPTYNRAACLAVCLESIVSQMPSEESIEIWVSDNASTDNTEEIARQYVSQYPFIHYRRNSANLGMDRNFLQGLQSARGKFVKLQGDDDYFKPGALAILLEALQHNEDCNLMYINLQRRNLAVRRGEGSSSYLRETTFLASHISAIVFRRENLLTLDITDRFIGSLLHPVFLQYSLLERYPNYCVLDCLLFDSSALPSESYSNGVVFIENYQAILRHFVGKGLSQEDYERECKETLFKHLIPNIPLFMRLGKPGHFDDFREVYRRNYQDKSYYEEGLSMIDAVLPS